MWVPGIEFCLPGLAGDAFVYRVTLARKTGWFLAWDIYQSLETFCECDVVEDILQDLVSRAGGNSHPIVELLTAVEDDPSPSTYRAQAKP